MSTLFVMILAVTNVWNPLPQLAGWWDQLNALSTPARCGSSGWVGRRCGPP